MKNLPDILKNTEFLKLWGNQVLLQVGFNICNYTALLIIANRTHSVFAQSQFYAALTLPAFFVSLIAGPLVDIMDRRKIMLVSNFVLAILFSTYVLANSNLVAIAIIAFLTSSAARFFIPAEAATIPLIVEEKILPHANAFFLFTLMGSVLLGYSITGPILQTFGGLGTRGEIIPFFLSSVLLFVSFILIFNLKKVAVTMPILPKGTIIKQVLELSWQGILEIKKDNKISLPIMLLVFVELIVGVLSVALLEYVRRYLQLPLTSVSLILMIPLVIGLVVGLLVLSEVEKKYGRRLSIYLSCTGIGLLFFVLGAMPLIGQSWLAVILFRIIMIACSFVFGVLIVVISVQARTVLQTHVKIQMQGRVFSLLDILIAISTPIPVLILGFFADKISILATLIFMGALIIVVAALGNKIVYDKMILGK